MHIKAQLIKLIFPYILSYSYVHHSGKRLTLAKPGQIFVKNEALQIFLKHMQSTPSTNTPKVESTHWKYHHEMEECNFTSINYDCFIFDPVRQNIHTQSTPKMHNQKGTTAACILRKNLEMEEQTISWIFFIINTAWVSSFQWPPINILLQFLSMTSITFATFISYFRSGTVKTKLYGSLTSEVHNLYRKQQPY